MRFQILKWGGFIAVLVLVGYGAYAQGVEFGAKHKAIKITDSRQLLDANFSLFWEAVDVVKENHINIDTVTDEALLEGAIQGMLAAIDDPYTVFFNKSDARKFEEDLAGSFGGIGAHIDVRNNQLIVVAPLKGSPADRVGVKAGDKILEVDDAVTDGMTVDEAVKIIRGKPGIPVRLLMFRDGWSEPKEVEIIREIIVVPTALRRKHRRVFYFLSNFINSSGAILMSRRMLRRVPRGKSPK